jgi:hypothetical protein
MPFSSHMHRIRCLSLFMLSLASSQARSPSARRCSGVYNRGFVFGSCVVGFISGFFITAFVSGFPNTVFFFDSCITGDFVPGFCVNVNLGQNHDVTVFSPSPDSVAIDIQRL